MRIDWRRELLVLGGVAAAALMVFAPLFLKPASTCLIGDARDREAARVPDALREAFFDAENMRVGLGRAALVDWEGLGDSLAVGGRAWVRNTERGADHYRVLSARYFRSNHFLYVPRTRAADETLAIAPTQSVQTLAEGLAGKHPQGVIAAGYVRFAPLETMAIATAPIRGAPVRGNAARYYTRPMERTANTWAYVVLAATRGETAGTDPHRTQLLPAQPDGRPATLAYALRLRRAPADRSAPPRAEEIAALGEIAAGSRLAAGELALYPITRLAACGNVTARH